MRLIACPLRGLSKRTPLSIDRFHCLVIILDVDYCLSVSGRLHDFKFTASDFHVLRL